MKQILLLFLLVAVFPLTGATTYIVESGGVLSFQEDENGYKIPDFSYSGYMMSNESLPTFDTEYGAEVSLASPSGNETTRIQNAINTVSALTPNEHGYRGAVVLGAGTWNFASILTVSASGVVIRGAGIDSTTLQYTGGFIQNGIQIGTPHSADVTVLYSSGGSGTTWDITTAVVDVGDMSFDLEVGHDIEIGDAIIIEHPCTAEWVAAIDGGGGATDPDWAVGSNPIRYYRHVTGVVGNTITIDAPVFYSLVKAVSQCIVYRYGKTTLQKIGVEHLTIDMDTGTNVYAQVSFHGLLFTDVENCWVRNVRTQNFRKSGIKWVEASRSTILDCEALDPHSPLVATERYSFNDQGGQLLLYENCRASQGRHNLESHGQAASSGIVWLRCISEDNYSIAIEHTHTRWGQGALFDNCLARHVGTPYPGEFFRPHMLWIGNHGDNSVHHGWAGVSSVCYKTVIESPGFAIIQPPPTGMCWEIECVGDWRDVHATYGYYPGALNISTSGTMPPSLFEAQLAQRTGAIIVGDVELDMESIDYGYTVTSTNNDRTFTITNDSGGALTGTVSVSSPFSVVSGTPWSLADSAQQVVTLRYNSASAGQHVQNVTVAVDGGSGRTVSLTGIAATMQADLDFDADTGTLIAPITDDGAYISTSAGSSGRAIYAVSIPTAGTYKVTASVNAPSVAANSFFVAFDGAPVSPDDTWDVVEITTGFEARDISRRGLGAFDAPESSPALYNLAAGTHFLEIQGREAGTQLATIAIALMSEPQTPAQSTGRFGRSGGMFRP